MKTILDNYSLFVENVTSNHSNNFEDFVQRLQELNNTGINIPLLITSAIGLGSETGEFQEIVKKILFQGKELSEDNVYHMHRELSDICWYWVNGCRALNINPNRIIEMNVEKLEARYPGGTFDVYYSENRKENDI